MNSDEPPSNGLTFRWDDRSASAWRLLAAFCLCLGVLALLPILFRIAPPAAPRLPSLSQSVLLLDASSPANQLVLNRAHDKSSLILRADQPGDLPLSAPLLPVFRPSFAGFEMRLKDPYAARDQPVRARLFQPTDLALPPLPPPPPLVPRTAAAAAWRLELSVNGALASRPLVVDPDLSAIKPKDLARLRFRLAVQPSGRVFLAMPIDASSEDRDLIPALQSALGRARFEPVGRPGVTWAPVGFRWVAQPPSAGTSPNEAPLNSTGEDAR
jgi:hypothetical protein